MANTFTTSDVIPRLLASGVKALRQNAIMPQLINRDYMGMAAQKGNVINVPVPSAIAARDVTPSVTMNSNVDSAPTVAAVTLDTWKEAPFQLSDNDVLSVMDGIVPMQASEAIKSLGNAFDKLILGKHTGLFGTVGTAGTTPFNGSITVAASAKKLLSLLLAPVGDRRAVIEPGAEANFVQNSAVLNPFGPDNVATAGIIEGQIGRKLGFDWYMDQNISTYTPGTGWASGFIASTVAGAIGDTTLNIINATASGQIKIGDIFTVTGDTSLGGGAQQYVVTVTTTVSATVQSVITFKPPLKAAVATGVTLVVQSAAYTVNMAFHRDAIAWASRPLADVMMIANTAQTVVDPITGIALRLELSRQYKQTTFSYDVLGGANIIRPELAIKILG